jgi:hypothetical protein
MTTPTMIAGTRVNLCAKFGVSAGASSMCASDVFTSIAPLRAQLNQAGNLLLSLERM